MIYPLICLPRHDQYLASALINLHLRPMQTPSG
jgi:hypothetical protein